MIFLNLAQTEVNSNPANSASWIDWNALSISIPIIVVLITIFFSLRKEKRDRDYEYRAIVDLFQTSNIINFKERTHEVINLFNNKEIFLKVDKISEAVVVENITNNPVLNLEVFHKFWKNGARTEYKYRRKILKGKEIVLVPTRNETNADETRDDEIMTITYSSLSGQKYRATMKKSESTILRVKEDLIYKKLVGHKHDAKTSIKKLN
ncbi:hypothetical protein CEY16_05505 [Halalkalibacillus sediminis]|uniref:Uncharacterized protein n=1 Tax=Halalkalibacillus sediminis TaxID=2018042 RepID=A0A2I0QYL0_9BACI|nr:hypothetical protein [Halalkalibacillus sediminis]PKR79200.1 hypothetical protein CEY16_05505 [Halalkalibacillus sediminis]